MQCSHVIYSVLIFFINIFQSLVVSTITCSLSPDCFIFFQNYCSLKEAQKRAHHFFTLCFRNPPRIPIQKTYMYPKNLIYLYTDTFDIQLKPQKKKPKRLSPSQAKIIPTLTKRLSTKIYSIYMKFRRHPDFWPLLQSTLFRSPQLQSHTMNCSGLLSSWLYLNILVSIDKTRGYISFKNT